MADRSITVNLRASVAGYKSAMNDAAAASKKVGTEAEAGAKRAKTATDKTTASVKDQKQHWDRLGKTAALAGGAIALGLGAGVKSFADFDKAMSGVRAALPDAVGQMDQLRQLAIKLGADSQFSTSEAAQGITELAKAGVSANAILGGGLKGALDLAASGQLEVGKAAEIAAAAMTQFKLAGDKVPHIADLLAAGAGKAMGSVEDLGMALQQSGLVAAGLGLSIEETAGGLAAFASAGLTGSDAGTSFKTMLQRLVPQSAQAQSMMDRLGISAFDANGNFVGLAKYAGILHEALKDLTPEARASAENIIFGSDAVRAANVLYEQGAQGIQGWISSVDEAGFAARQAATLTDNLSGDLERLGGAIDSAFVQNGQGANNALRTLVQYAQSGVEWFSRLPGPIQSGSTAVAALGAAGLLAFAGISKLVTSGSDLVESLGKIRDLGPRASRGVDLATKSVKLLGAAIVSAGIAAQATRFGDTSELGTERLTQRMLTAGNAVKGFDEIAQQHADQTDSWFSSANVRDFGDAVRYAFDPGVGRRVEDFAGGVAAMFGGDNLSAMAEAESRIREIDRALAGLVQSGKADQASRSFVDFANAANKQGVDIDKLRTKFPQYAEALAAVANAAGDVSSKSASIPGASGPAQVSLEELGDAGKTAQEKLDDLATTLEGLGGSFRSLRAKQRDWREALDDLQHLMDKDDKGKFKLTWDERNAKLDEAAQKTLAVVAEQKRQGKSETELASTMLQGRAAFILAANAMGIKGQAARDLADAEELIPSNVKSDVEVTGVEKAKTDVGKVKDALKLPPTVSTELTLPRIAARRADVEDFRKQLEVTDQTQVHPFVNLLGDDAALAALANLNSTLANLDGKTATVSIYTNAVVSAQAGRILGEIRDLKPKWVGGYTGDGGKYEPMGITHGGEFVSTMETTSRWRTLLEWMHAGRDPRGFFGLPGYVGGGYVRPAASVLAPVGGAMGHSETWDQRIESVTVVARDVDDFERQMEQKRRLAKLGGRRVR